MTIGSYTECVRKIVLVAAFAIAMAYIEAAVVVYLRELFYPEGFAFPLERMPERLTIIELFREAATIVILAVVAGLSGKKLWERCGVFLMMFGIWDIFYYVWLKVTCGWPSSLVDWDVLFLIPAPWIGPVIAPMLVSALMIAIGLSIVRLIHLGYDFKPTRTSWGLVIVGTIMILFSFMRDCGAAFEQRMPEPYSYVLLALGLVSYVIGYVHSHAKATRILFVLSLLALGLPKV